VAEGRFSVSMDGGRIPLADPRGGDMAGHMAIRAQVKPGPVAQEFLVLVNELFTVLKQGNFKPLDEQTGALLSIDTTDVEFRMVDRRVYHRNLKFVVGTTPITTYGSVGLDDETLAMVAEIPLQANLLGRDLALGTMEGQTLKLPIGGTLNKPKLDRGALRQLTASILQNVTKGVLQNEVGKQLERFLPLRQQTVPTP
jgi:translocation and assembly module TamB